MSGALVGIGLFLMILVCFALVAVAEVTRRQRRRTVAADATEGATEPAPPGEPAADSAGDRPGTVVIPMGGYHGYLVSLAKELRTTDMDTLYAHHDGFCARCGTQFTREALAHLDLFASGEFQFGNMTVVGATREGSAVRAGRCPKCGFTMLRLTTK